MHLSTLWLLEGQSLKCYKTLTYFILLPLTVSLLHTDLPERQLIIKTLLRFDNWLHFDSSCSCNYCVSLIRCHAIFCCTFCAATLQEWHLGKSTDTNDSWIRYIYLSSTVCCLAIQ